MYRMIMVPTDGSGSDREAIRVALRVAERSHAKVRLVRVLSTGAFFAAGASPDAATVTAELLEEERDRILSELNALAAECRKACDAEIEVVVEDGAVSDALQAYASRNKVDLIVISSHGRGGIARVSLGSVTDLLIRHTTIPVLVAKLRASYLSPAAIEPFRRIVVPLDGSSLAEQILPRVVALAKLDEAQFILLRVLAPRSFALTGTANQKHSRWDEEIAAAQAYLSHTARMLREEGFLATTDVVIGEDIAEAIVDYASTKRADLIAIATHGRGGVSRALRGSVADVVTRTSRTSMLVFRSVGALEEEAPAKAGRLSDGMPVIA